MHPFQSAQHLSLRSCLRGTAKLRPYFCIIFPQYLAVISFRFALNASTPSRTCTLFGARSQIINSLVELEEIFVHSYRLQVASGIALSSLKLGNPLEALRWTTTRFTGSHFLTCRFGANIPQFLQPTDFLLFQDVGDK